MENKYHIRLGSIEIASIQNQKIDNFDGIRNCAHSIMPSDADTIALCYIGFDGALNYIEVVTTTNAIVEDVLVEIGKQIVVYQAHAICFVSKNSITKEMVIFANQICKEINQTFCIESFWFLGENEIVDLHDTLLDSK